MSSPDATISACFALHVLSTGFNQEVSRITALRSTVSTNTAGGPAVPTEWTYEEVYNFAHDKTALHIDQYQAASKQLPEGFELCRVWVIELEDKQKRLSNGLVAGTDTQQAVTARDMLRARAIQQLQQGLATAAAIQHAHGGTSFLACADEFGLPLSKLERLAPANYKTMCTTQHMQAACSEGVEAIAAWRARHDHTVATAATDAALDVLWRAIGASKGAVCNVTDDVLNAVGRALDTEYNLLTDRNPMSDFPITKLRIAVGSLAKYHSVAAAYLVKLQSDIEWASDTLSKYQYAQSLQYPPSVQLLQSLQDQLHDADDIIGHLQVDIATNIKRKKPVTELQTRLEIEQQKLRDGGIAKLLMSERASLAREHFPELLASNNPWSTDIGISASIMTSDAAQRGLLAEGRKLSDFVQLESVQCNGIKRVYRATDASGKQWAVKQFLLQDDRQLKHFFRQISQSDKLKHPQLAAVHAVFEDVSTDGTTAAVFLQMPWYSGGDLCSWLTKTLAKRRSLAISVGIVRDLLLGLQHLHSNNQVHCDIKPGNIFLTANNRAVLGDLDGLRDVGASLTTNLTGAQATLQYIAPEILDKQQNIKQFTACCDMYSAGLVTSEVLSGIAMTEAQLAQKYTLISALTCVSAADRVTATVALQNQLLALGAIVEDQQQCFICSEVFTVSSGVECSATEIDQRHFTCNDCFDSWIKSKVTSDDDDQTALNKLQLHLAEDRGRIQCPGISCTSDKFTPQCIAQHVTPETHHLYMIQLDEGSKRIVMPELQKEFNQTITAIRAELAAAVALNSIEEAARMSELHVIENIITIKCPRCTQVCTAL
jgi:serine/threonine protein kinase